MAEYSGFFDGPQEYGQSELARYFDNIYESGINMVNTTKAGFTCTVVTGGLKIEPGFAIIKGFYYYLDTAITIPTPASSNIIRGGIFIGLDLSTKKVSLYKKESESATYPTPTRNDIVWELQLNIYYVNTNGAITITDRRFTDSLCGVIRPKNVSEFDAYLEQIKAQWYNWFNQQQGVGWRSIYVQADMPTGTIQDGSLWMQSI